MYNIYESNAGEINYSPVIKYAKLEWKNLEQKDKINNVFLDFIKESYIEVCLGKLPNNIKDINQLNSFNEKFIPQAKELGIKKIAYVLNDKPKNSLKNIANNKNISFFANEKEAENWLEVTI